MAALSLLPNEILSLITAHLERPGDLLQLSLSNRRLSEFAKLDGWKALLKGRFGVSGLDLDARNSVHGLTTLYRNWERKGLIARYLEPSVMTTSINTWQDQRWRGPRGQTMGYQPSIDSYEEVHGAWDEKREVLAWSAGTQIVVRVKESGSIARKKWEVRDEQRDASEETMSFDAFRHKSSWLTYKIPESFEGRDDITSLKLLRPQQRNPSHKGLVFGTASGELKLLDWNSQDKETSEQQYETDWRNVGSVSLSSSNEPLLAATLGDTALALYRVGQDSASPDAVQPLTEVTPIIQGMRNARLWSCSFLSEDKVAIGLGPSYEPVHVYKITPDGFLSEPLRTFTLDSKVWKGTRSNAVVSQCVSVYPILPIPSSAQAGSDGGNVLLSGGYDGIIRLHDMRSPRGFETMFWDPTNDSSIYSLALQGLERIVAGVSMHSMIKVFDLRLSGSHAYQTISPPPKPISKPSGQDHAYNAIANKTKKDAAIVSGGWNLYLNPRNPPPRNAYRDDYSRGRRDSPVYSLSIPSATSANVYAGLEGAVQSLTFHGIADTHPDTALSQSIVRFADSGVVDVRASYNPQGDALDLGMYEQGTDEGLGMQLLVQDAITTAVVKNKERMDAAKAKGLDERWRDLRNEGDRWVRGAVPTGPRRGGRGRGRGGRGGGRGRGRGA
jgi:WD40 repeat protein